MFDAFDSGRRRVELRSENERVRISRIPSSNAASELLADRLLQEIYSSRADGDVAAITAHAPPLDLSFGIGLTPAAT